MTGDPLAKLGLDFPTPSVTIGEQMIVRIAAGECSNHGGRTETEFSITFPHDDTFEIAVSLAGDDMTPDSMSRLKAVGANLVDIILRALEQANGDA